MCLKVSPNGLAAGAIVLILSVAYACTLAPGLTWANHGSDGGDLVTAAAVLGVAHPTGYPTYVLLSRLFQSLPAGDLAYRTNLFSAFCAVFTALWVFVIVRGLLPGRDWTTTTAASIAALGFGFSPLTWSQAVITEVYSLNAWFTAVILLFLLWEGWQPSPSGASPWGGRWPARCMALVVGLSLGNHLTIALPAAVWVGWGVFHARPGQRWRDLGQRLVWVGLGSLVYLALPLCAAAHPPVNWGRADTWEGFWWVVSAQPYRELAFGLPPMFLASRVQAWATLLVQQFGWAGVAVGCTGLLYADRVLPPEGRSVRGWVWLTAAMAVLFSLFAMTYNTADSYAYLIPVSLIFAIWVGLGCAWLLKLAARWNLWGALLLAAVAFVLVAWKARATTPLVDASRDSRAATYAARVLTLAPTGAIVFTSSDRDTFSLWYAHYALGHRPDLSLVAGPLLKFAWYRENLRVTYPRLHIPERPGPNGNWREAVTEAHRRRFPICQTFLEDDDHNDDDRVIGCDASDE
ncbi:MAG: DUF2723 domain-containing protein [Chloroflexaceae bacterium]|nr:DUF2723 domain-containing protein [Chloroflexaceae bacterium]